MNRTAALPKMAFTWAMLALPWIFGCDLEREEIQKGLKKEFEQAVANGQLENGLRKMTGAIPSANSGQPGAVPAGAVLPPGSPPGYGPTGAAGPAGVPGQLVSARPEPPRPMGLPARSPQTILVSSFNIQTFGEKKIANRTIAERLATLIRQFDVVAIQEVRATDQTVIPQLLQYINANGGRYDYILGPRLGRTVSKEQYCFIYDTNRIVSGPNASYTVEDRADLLHREPLVGRFVTRVPQGYRPYSFSLMNIHTDPDEVKLELPVMHTVLQAVREYEWATAGEDDVLMMGDLNAAPKIFGNLAKVPGIYWVIREETTNTRRTQIYDNILFDRGLTNEFTGRAGVLDMAEMFRISTEEALKLSDHLPIWAEFTIVEQPSAASYPQTYTPPANYSAAAPPGGQPWGGAPTR